MNEQSASAYRNALSRMEEICSKQEMCRHDIEKKLIKYALSDKEKEVLMETLIQEKFVDESRFASFFVNDKWKINKWGKIKIKYHLRQKRIPEAFIQDALDGIDEETYISILRELLAEKNKSITDKNQYQRKAKLMRFAMSKGFEQELVFDELERLLEK